MRAVQRLAGTGCAALVVGLAFWQAPLARAAADASTTVLVLDVSGSMADPARIPPDFPEAAKLKARQDSVGRLVELAHPGQKVPLSVIAGGLLGLPDLLSLRSELDTYLQQHKVDPESISKLAVLEASAGALLTALQFERDHAGVDDRVGIVAFGSDAAVLAPVSPQVAGLGGAIAGLKTDGSTNMGAGLQQALELVRGQPNPSVALLTDGWNNEGMSNADVLGGPVRQAATERVPICTIGVGESPADVDQRLLLDVASRAGGGYHFVGGGTTLTGDLLACHHAVAGQWLGDQRGTVRQGQVAQGQGFTLPAGRRRLTVTLTWPGSQLDLRVVDPAGRPVGAGYPGASVARAGGLAVLTVTNPAAGHWGMSVAGVQTTPAGDPFVATASTDGTTASPRRDDLVNAVSAPIDDLERDLRLTVYVSGAVAAALVLLWLAGRVRRLFTRGRPAATFVTPAGVQPGYPAQAGYAPPGGQPGYTPPAPAGYTPASGQAAYQAYPAHSQLASAAAMGPAASRPSPARGCAGCLLVLVFWVDLLVLAASAASLYLWTTPLLTFPG